MLRAYEALKVISSHPHRVTFSGGRTSSRGNAAALT